jgi:hypothetical protein
LGRAVEAREIVGPKASGRHAPGRHLSFGLDLKAAQRARGPSPTLS